jgi:hypothetical protein
MFTLALVIATWAAEPYVNAVALARHVLATGFSDLRAWSSALPPTRVALLTQSLVSSFS